VRALIRFEVDRAAALLDAGAPLVATLRGRARFAVAGFVAGGRAALGAIQRASYDVSAGPPRATRTARARALTSVLLRGGR
jgi:phytoene/squalene synthetase